MIFCYKNIIRERVYCWPIFILCRHILLNTLVISCAMLFVICEVTLRIRHQRTFVSISPKVVVVRNWKSLWYSTLPCWLTATQHFLTKAPTPEITLKSCRHSSHFPRVSGRFSPSAYHVGFLSIRSGVGVLHWDKRRRRHIKARAFKLCNVRSIF